MEKRIKKVAFVVNRVSLAGGAERVICTLASEFARRGIDTTIITRQSTECGYPIDENVKIWASETSIKLSLLRNFVRNLKMRKFIKNEKPDIVISFITVMNLQTILFTLGLKCKVIVSERIYPEIIKNPQKFASKILYRFADGVVFQTNEAKACFKGKVNKRSTVIYNPLTKELPFKVIPDSKERYIATIGRLSEQKNHELLIRAFAEFVKMHTEYQLKIFGEGHLKENLKQLAEELGVSDKVHFMGAVENAPNHIVDASMFVLSSDYEGMPNVLAEAMAMGLPCVATNCLGGGAAALIQDGENGLLVPCKDVNKLYFAMTQIADSQEKASEFADRAKLIRGVLSVEKITQEWIDYCYQIINA